MRGVICIPETLVVNFFAGPAAGKTTCAWEVAAELKKRNIVTEYVPEYAKELVWDNRRDMLDGSYANQRLVLEEQARRVDRLIGKVDVVVTDSPVLLQPAYCKENIAEFEQEALQIFSSRNNFNLFINRGNHFEQAGRVHTLDESRKVDEEVKDILSRNSIYYGTYSHSTIDVVVQNIQKTLNKLNERGNEEMPKYDKEAYAEEMKARTKDLTDRLETGMSELYQSDKYKAYLNAMSQFHHYSTKNIMLIHKQKPDATRIASFAVWKEKFTRSPKKGEKGLYIYAPAKQKEPEKVLMEKLDPATGEPILDKNNQPVMEEMTPLSALRPKFVLVPVFDVSQTVGDPLPELVENITGNVEHYEAFIDALKGVSPLPIAFEPMDTDQDGYCRFGEKIGIREGMSETQTVDAIVHEIVHDRLHDKNHLPENTKPKKARIQEIEAESIAYVVCQHYGIETSPNSFGYLAEHGSQAELKASIDTIRKESHTLITAIDERFNAICQERGIDLTAAKEPEQATTPPDPADPSYSTDSRTENIAGVDFEFQDVVPEAVSTAQRNYQKLADLFPQVANGEYYYQRMEAGDAMMPLSLEWIDTDRLSIMHTYTQNGDLMYDPMMVFEIDREAKTATAVEFEQSNPPLYQRINEDGTGHSIDGNGRERVINSLQGQLDRFTSKWLENIGNQGYVPVNAVLRDAEYADPSVFFNDAQKPFSLAFIYDTEGTTIMNNLDRDDRGDMAKVARVDSFRNVTFYEENLPKEVVSIVEGVKLTHEKGKQENEITSEQTAPHDLSDKSLSYNAVIEEIMPDVEAGEYDLFAIYRENGEWHCDYKLNQDESISDWFNDIKEKDPFALYYMGADFSRGSYPYVFDKVFAERLWTEFEALPPNDTKRGELDAFANFFEDNMGEFSPEIMNYIVHEYEKPLASLSEVVGFSLKSDDPDEYYDSDKADTAIAVIEEKINALIDPDRTADKGEQQPMPEEPDTIMPDPSIGFSEMNLYGYTADDMLPLTTDRAIELFNADLTVYILFPDNTEMLVFETDDIHSYGANNILGITKADWEMSPLYAELSAQKSEPAAEAEIADDNPASFSIFQVKDIEEMRYHRFASLKQLEADNLPVDRANYDLAYTAPLPPKQTLEELFEKFNNEHPKDYTGRSMSVSDVVVIERGGESTAHYVDNFGFAEVPVFLAVRSEQAQEQSEILKSEIPVYKMTGEIARQNDELDAFRASIKLNKECGEAIDTAIRANSKNGEMAGTQYVDTKAAAKSVIEEYGVDRVAWVLAANINKHDWDGRLSNTNKAWAKEFDTPNPDYYLKTHLTILDSFSNRFREAEKEKPSLIKALNDTEQKIKQQKPEPAVDGLNKSKKTNREDI